MKKAKLIKRIEAHKMSLQRSIKFALETQLYEIGNFYNELLADVREPQIGKKRPERQVKK